MTLFNTQRLIDLINRFSFSRKLACTFFFCSLLTFIVINIIMNILYSTVVVSTNTDMELNTEAFSQFSNSQILSNTQAYLMSGTDVYEQIITQAHRTYQQFINRSDIYASALRRGRNPALTQSFVTPRYDRSSIYFYSPNSTFYNHPFLDKVLSSSATEHFPTMLKRINCFYQSKTDPNDITIRTVPGTNDFYLPNAEIVTQRINNSKVGFIIQTDRYYDMLSLADNSTQLFALRLLAQAQNYYLLFQIQVRKEITDMALNNIYSFPGTHVFLIKMFNQAEKKYSLLGKNSQWAEIDLTPYLKQGSQTIQIDNYPYLVTTRTLLDHNNDFAQQQEADNKDHPEEDEVTDMKLIIFLNKTETQLPKIVYDSFLQREYNVIVYILYGWSFVVLMVVVAIGIVIGDTIFSYFSLIRKKCRQYLTNPQQISKIDSQLKQFIQNEPQRQLLFQNIVSIMICIENKKKQNRKNFRIGHDVYPLNRMGIDFQNRMKINDYAKFEEIGSHIREKERDVK